MTTVLIAAALTVGISGICSLLEAFILSIGPADIEGLKQKFPRRGRQLERFKTQLDETSSAILTLNTIANTMGASLVGALAAKQWADWRVGFTSAVLVLFILFCSEIIPKNVGVAYRKPLLKHLVFPIRVVRILMLPFSYLAKHSVKPFMPDHSARPQEELDEEREREIILLAEKHAKDGSLTSDERDIISNTLELDDLPVSEIMTPRTVVTFLEKNFTVDQVFQDLDNVRFARLPVYEDNIDTIVGLVRRRDLLTARADDLDDKTVGELMTENIFIPENATAADALQLFLRSHQQLAVVVDEFGSTAGVVAMEDIVEHILGREIYEEDDVAVDMREFAKTQAGDRSATAPPYQPGRRQGGE